MWFYFIHILNVGLGSLCGPSFIVRKSAAVGGLRSISPLKCEWLGRMDPPTSERQIKRSRAARDGATIEIADVADLMLECTWPLKLGRGDPACMRISAQHGSYCSWPSLAALQAAACRCWRPCPRSRHI